MKNLFTILTFIVCILSTDVLLAQKKIIIVDLVIDEKYYNKNYTEGQALELDTAYKHNGSDSITISKLDSVRDILASGDKVKVQYVFFKRDENGVLTTGTYYLYAESEVDVNGAITWITNLFEGWCKTNNYKVVKTKTTKNLYWIKAKH